MENKDIEDLLLKVKLTPSSKLKENILQDVYKIKITENKFQLRNTAFKKIAFAFCICVSGYPVDCDNFILCMGIQVTFCTWVQRFPWIDKSIHAARSVSRYFNGI